MQTNPAYAPDEMIYGLSTGTDLDAENRPRWMSLQVVTRAGGKILIRT
jgi:hypothetical protein